MRFCGFVIVGVLLQAILFLGVGHAQSPLQVNSPHTHRSHPAEGEVPKPLSLQSDSQEERARANNARIIAETQTNNNSSLQKQQSEIYESNRTVEKSIQYTLPSLEKVAGTEHYRNAFIEIQGMLEGEAEPSSKRAVFLVENAWYEDKASYAVFDKRLREIVQFCKLKLTEEGYDENDPMALHWMLQRFFSDTLMISHNGKTAEHLPFEYDFEDFWGYEDFSKMFVSKLLWSNKGQCHSLPLLYKLLADEADIKAWLAFSPEHSYIKFQDKQKDWKNLELTNAKLTADSWISGSGYVKAEAVINQVYMDTLGDASTLAYCLTDLAQGYYLKYGFDPFVLECVNTALEYDPSSLRAAQIRSDYYTMTFKHILDQLGREPSPEELKRSYPKAYALYQEWEKAGQMVDDMGYERMPPEAYQKWLNSLDAEVARQEDAKLKEELRKAIKVKTE